MPPPVSDRACDPRTHPAGGVPPSRRLLIPGHGGPGIVANTYLEGSYTEHYPDITQDAEGMRKLFRQFSFPGGIPSHTSP